MGKINSLLVSNPIFGFVILTFFISAASFLIMLKIPEAQTPESMKGLPVWLIAIWSPNIAAIIIWLAQKKALLSIKAAFSIPQFSWWMLLVLIPLLVAGILLIIEVSRGNTIQWSNFKLSYVLPLVFINLIMGPLGEELGWRGFLYPILKSNYGWMGGALVIGAIWAIWHAPLWFLDSPQSKIPFWAFAINVVLLSILMSIIYNHSQGSILAVVLLHLTFNVSLGFIDILGSHQSGVYIIKSLYIYVPLVLVLIGIHEITKTYQCEI
ncbi:CPBP family intramembrane glutamic endopeptidase [uncultured Algibacter sp.]|uniref:CPBP family intramembrane glutamic endopeptidase n=1 Tax=uncultured Algibacter sp. TaxID=298659 RepID=UPI00261C5E74|nr:CPBP family intramembrane glutamic endopeptidase [uncultured Algibacter sp.]